MIERAANENGHGRGVRRGDRRGDFTTDRRVLILTTYAVMIGAISAFVAAALVSLIGIVTNLSYFGRFSTRLVSIAGSPLGLAAWIVPVAGGLVIGLMARYGSPKIRGHGIPEALEAILIGRSRIEPKVALLKPLSSAISIGTGGPFGAEGPIIMTGGAIGSLFAQLIHLSPSERKTLLTAGAAGGMAAVFATPIAAVLLAVELLLFEWKPRSLIPVAAACITAAAVRIPLLGQGPLFPVTPHPALSWLQLGYALAVGVAAGVGSGFLTRLVYAFEDGFHSLRLHWMWWPLIGGLVVGIGGLVDLRALGVGYDLIHHLLLGDLGKALLLLVIVKALIWSFALGSGTSGGVLAPLLIMGGALGAILARWIPGHDAGLWAAVGMCGMMAGTMRSPFTSILFTVELTHDINLLPGLMVGAVAAEAVTVLLLRRSILTEKVARRGHHLTREYSIDPLSVLPVGEVMSRTAPTIAATSTVGELTNRIARGSPPVANHHGLPLVDTDGRLVGLVTHGDLLRALQDDPSGQMTALAAGTDSLVVTYPDEPVEAAVQKMLQNGIGRLPVVNRTAPDRLVGYLGRSGIMAARQRLIEEDLKEPGWITRLSGRGLRASRLAARQLFRRRRSPRLASARRSEDHSIERERSPVREVSKD